LNKSQLTIFDFSESSQQYNLLKNTPIGLYCAVGDFYIDPKKPVMHAIVSHAHSDHAVKNNKNIYCTAPTKALMDSRNTSKTSTEVFHIKEYGETFILNDVKVTLYPAGHMLGSAMVLLENDNIKYLYTGDFKLQDDGSCEKIEIVSADVLITETTFANPRHIHPDADEEMKKLLTLEGKNIIIGTYAIGKAQRITHLALKNLPNKIIMVHSSLIPFHTLYQKFGFDLGNWLPYSRNVFKDTDNSVLIVPPYVYHRYKDNSKYHSMFATGWDWFYKNTSIRLHISDHADWNDLQILVEKVAPKKIFTVHGDGRHMQYHYSMLGISVGILN
jgi:putative mRNA 3-end processing factor